jgi:hypothetical protein
MAIQPVQSSPALYQSEANSGSLSATRQATAPSAVPQDRVTLSSAAKAKAAGLDKDHDGDSK